MLAETEMALAAMLPEQLAKVIQDYKNFAAGQPKDDSKDFASYQSACKGSLAHIEQLLKLARWVESRSDVLANARANARANVQATMRAEDPPEEPVEDDSVIHLVSRAKSALNKMEIGE